MEIDNMVPKRDQNKEHDALRASRHGEALKSLSEKLVPSTFEERGNRSVRQSPRSGKTEGRSCIHTAIA